MKEADQYRAHWDKIYATKPEKEVSWFQTYPQLSISLIEHCKLPAEAAIIDVGGGNSRLADILLDKGYQHLHVLDISGNAIAKAKERLGEKASAIHWITSDILDFKPSLQFDLWHDRASFHFQTSEADISRYISIAKNAINPGGYLLLSTFSTEGPEKCSGLEVKRYSEDSLADKIGNSFEKIKCSYEDHLTPFQTHQHFLFCLFQKTN